MVKRAKLANVGVETETEVDPAANVAADMTTEVTQEGNEGGFAPGTLEHITGETTGETTGEGDTEADIADQEAAGVADKPTRPAHSGGNGSNQPRAVSPKTAYNNLKKKVVGLGVTLGASKTSMIALADAVTEAAQDGAITVEQVPEIYDSFKSGVTKASTYEDAGEVSDEAALGQAPAKSLEQQLSKLRQFVNLGIKYDTEALDLIRKARNMHIELLRTALGDAEFKKSIKPGSTYAVLVDVARAQLKKQKDAVEAGKRSGVKHIGLAPVLTDDELRAIMTQEVKEPVDKTGEDKLLDTLILAKATKKGSDKRNAITCEELDNAIEWLRAALARVAPDLLGKHDKEEQDAADTRRKAAEAKAEAERAKAEKAAQPKLTKAERQKALADAVAEQPAA